MEGICCCRCRVRLLVHARSGACVALKAVRGAGGAAGGAGGAREAALHRVLRHPHVLRCMGERLYAGRHYLFLEYAQGGELFDRIGLLHFDTPFAALDHSRRLSM